VALETEVQSLVLVTPGGVVVANRASPLSTSNAESLAIRKARDRSCRKFEGGLHHLCRLKTVVFEALF